MIVIKNKAALSKMEKAGELLSDLFVQMAQLVQSGVSTLDIDTWIEQRLRTSDMVPRTKGYRGYRHASCISLNDTVIHGIPSSTIILHDGDVVKIDIVASWQGYCADMTRIFFVGSVSKQAEELVRVAQVALDNGIAKAYAGNHLSDISAAIQQEVEGHGFGVVRDFAGHGLGKYLHEEPEVPNFGIPGKGPLLRPGMTLAIEPMITMGDYEVCVMEDGWTVKTCDGSLSAHVEDTIVITTGEPKILTRSNYSKNGEVT
jgi:methionyl aminopeptidase